MKSLTFKMNKAMVLLLLLTFAAIHARGEDTYNFYFKKPNKQKSVSKEPVRLIEVQEDDPRDMPSHWSSGKKRYFIRKKKSANYVQLDRTPVAPADDTEEVAQVVSKKPEVKKDREHKKWAVSMGFGNVGGKTTYSNSSGGVSTVDISKFSYVLGGRYQMNRYFDVNVELQLPIQVESETSYEYDGYYNNGYDYDSYSTGFYQDDSDEVDMGIGGSIGIGVTPLHLSVFGGEFIELGVDGGVMFGKRPKNSGMGAFSQYYGYSATDTLESTATVFVGPRIGFNIGSRINIRYSYKLDTRFTDYSHSSLSVAFKW